MKVEGKHIKKVTLLRTLKGTERLTWLAGTVFNAEDGFPQDIRDEIGLNRIGVLNIEYEEPQSDSSVAPSPQIDEAVEIKVDGVDYKEMVEEDIPEDPPDKPKTEPKKRKKAL
jgi:hypothetical protein